MSGVVSADKLRKSIRKLYSAILREGKQWPVEINRRRRSVYSAIPGFAHSRFGDQKNVKDFDKIKELAKHGADELLALRRLKENTHMNAYPLTKRLIPKFVAREAPKVLADEKQEKIQKQEWGFSFRMMKLLFGTETIKSIEIKEKKKKE